MTESEIRREIRVPLPLDRVFPFFADAANLERITPPWLRFEILTERPIVMEVGALIDYRIRMRGVPMRWRTRITAWEPPYRFVDEQLRGPYRQWIHEHTFEAAGDETICRDHVRYRVPGGALIDRLFVRRDVERIFDHRTERLREIFSNEASPLTV